MLFFLKNSYKKTRYKAGFIYSRDLTRTHQPATTLRATTS